MRFGYDRFDELDIKAAAEGWEPGWRMDHDEREENRQQVLRGRMDKDLWVFAYGSLIWNPGVYVDEYRYATLNGWQRKFCMRLLGGRGSRERPGLMAALDQGGDCHGLALRIAAPLVERETAFMWRREMFSGGYVPSFFPIATPQGTVEALTFVINPEKQGYLPNLPQTEVAEMIAFAEGDLGPNFEYLDSLVCHMNDLGIEDPEMTQLHTLTQNRRAG